jgi:ribonuclease HI
MKRSSVKPSPPRAGKLFAEPHPPAPPSGLYLALIDGAARGNPGPASYGVVILQPNGEKLETIQKKIGIGTNNVAEYYALISALDFAHAHNIAKLRVRSDSELLVRQMQGRYKVKSADLRPLYERALKLARGLEYFAIEHVPRELNREADGLANAALDRWSPKTQETRKSRVETREAKSGAQRVRARYVKGVLVPVQPLRLIENEEVEIEIHKPTK